MAKQAIEGASRVNAFRIAPERENVIIIGRDTDHGPGEHPLFDKSATTPPKRELVNSMKLFGWQAGSVILLRKDGDHLVVVNGRERTKAARQANMELEAEGADWRVEMIVMLEKAEDGDVVRSMIVLNELNRVDDMLERGRKALVMQNHGKSLKDIATAFGVTTSSVSQMMKLATDCAKPLIEAIERNEISGSLALQLADMPREQQVSEYERLKAEGKLSVGEAKKVAQSARASRESTSSDKPKRLPIGALRKICALHEKNELKAEIDPMALKVLRCLLGEIDPHSIKGMEAALREAGFSGEE